MHLHGHELFWYKQYLVQWPFSKGKTRMDNLRMTYCSLLVVFVSVYRDVLKIYTKSLHCFL